MMKIHGILVFFFVMSCLSSKSQAPDMTVKAAAVEDVSQGASSLGNLISRNAAGIFKVTGFSSAVFLADIPVDISLPGKGIYISRTRLKKILAGNDATYSGLIIQFLIAHELVHQLQFARYKENMSNIVSCEVRRLFECQADVLAGVYVSGLYDLPDSVVVNARLTPFMIHGLEYVYSIGDEENSRIFHPSFSERRTAFRLGLAYPVVRNNLEKGTNTFIGEAIDYKKGEDSVAWSLRIARYIMHYPNSVNKNIVFIPCWAYSDTARMAIWDTSSRNPAVFYKLGYFKNTNAYAINLFLQCKLNGKYRDGNLQDPKNAVLQGKTKNYVVQLGAGDSVYITGNLNWYGLSTPDFMPHFASPPDPETLFSAEPAGSKDVVFDANCPSYDFGSQTGARFKEMLSIELQIAIAASLHDFKDLEVGFGTNAIPDQVDYSTNLSYNTNAEVTHYLPEHTAELTITLYEGNDSSLAKENFEKAAGALIPLAASGDLKIEDDYRRFYDDGVDTEKSVESMRSTIHHIVKDTILITIDKYGERRTIQGLYKPSGTKVSLDYKYDPRQKNDRYKVDIIVYSPHS